MVYEQNKTIDMTNLEKFESILFINGIRYEIKKIRK